MRSFRACAPLLVFVFVSGGCGDDDAPEEDAGTGLECLVPELFWSHPSVATVPMRARTTGIEMRRDFCADAVITIEASTPGIVDVTGSAPIPEGRSRADVDITGVSPGTTTLTATLAIGGMEQSATLEVEVTDDAVPACAGSASGNLAPGGEVVAGDGTLAGAGVRLPEGASRPDRYHVDALDATVGCGADQVPAGYGALGPAVEIGPVHARFMRELPMTIPLRLSLLPPGAHRGHVEVSYTGSGVTEPRIVPVAVRELAGVGEGLLTFEAPRFGTYQAVVRDDAGTARARELTFKGIVGVSMGGVGSGLIGFRNPERFDFVGPLGAAWDWRYLLDYIRTYHVGGFCTEDEFVADTTGECDEARTERTPPARWIHEVTQDFEHWFYDDRTRGHGSTFDREEYITIFQDLARMYGNMNTDRVETDAEPNITPPGVADDERLRDRGVRCSNPVIIPPTDGSPGTGVFDDEYNPAGAHQVIAFCDGAEVRVDGERDVGIWDPAGDNSLPIEVALAVDRNANGVRDPGEPVIRNFREPFDDCGLDRLCNADETGFDAITNPDPAGDDYHYQYNAAGTEGNRVRDGDRCDVMGGEAFLDVGLDGVMGTPQLADGGFDNGEANGCHDITLGAQRMLARGPLGLLHGADEQALRDIAVFMDGGIRDLFMAGVAANHTSSGFPFRGLPLRYYNGHPSMHLDGRALNDEEFVFTDINWDEIGRYVMARYGDIDVDPGLFEAGDGAHVGTNTQAVNRILGVLAWMSAQWPGGDRRIVSDRLCRTGTAGCDDPNQVEIDFTSPTTMRTGPAGIILPPGYFAPENQDLRYPVVYFLHGYGMEPQDLIDIAILIWNFMTAPNLPEARRFQKMIFVFPDGRCRGSECVKGTFYTDAPSGSPDAAQMETFMLDLMDYVDATYRTKDPEMHGVVD